MASLDSLPADQRAVLQLLLKQGKSYDDLSELLRIDAVAVRERARDAVDSLGPADPAVDPDRRDEIADYLLGQQSASQRAATREYLEGSASGRAWARGAAGTLEALAPEGLPEIPAERERERPSEQPGAAAGAGPDTLERRPSRRPEITKSSRTGGILILAGLGIALAVGLILLIGGGDDDKSSNASTSTTAAGAPRVLAQAQLTPPGGSASSQRLGIAFVVRQGNQTGLAVQARGLQPSTRTSAYGIWLRNSRGGNPRFLGFIQTPVGQDGNLQSVSALTQDISRFDQLLLTRESQENPKSPGTVVLRGTLRKPPAGGQTQQGAGTATTPGAGVGTSTTP
jgi:hypothetical protein